MFGEFSQREASLLEALQVKGKHWRSERDQQLLGGNCVHGLLFRLLALYSLGTFTLV